MKIEIEIKDELVKKFGEEAIRIYLTRKAERLEDLPNQDAEQADDPETDNETLQNAWSTFNKRGISC